MEEIWKRTEHSNRMQVPTGRSHSLSSHPPAFQQSNPMDTNQGNQRNTQTMSSKEDTEKNVLRRPGTAQHGKMKRQEVTGI